MSQRCQITGKTNVVGNNISHSKAHTKRLQRANLFKKRIYLPSERRWVTIRVSASALRSLEKFGVEEFLKKKGISL